jgi:hypothetical protein
VVQCHFASTRAFLSLARNYSCVFGLYRLSRAAPATPIHAHAWVRPVTLARPQVVLLGAIDRSTKNGAWTGGFLFNFAFLLVSSFALGAAAGLGIAVVLKTTHFAGPHQVRG